MKDYKEIASIIDKMAPRTRKALSTSDIQDYTGIKLEPFTEIDELVKLQFRKLRGDDANGMKYWYKKYKDRKIDKSDKTEGDLLIQVFGPAIKKYANMLENKEKNLKNIIKKLIKEELDTKDKILFLAKDLDYIQNEYEEVLSDSELNQLSEFISQLHKKANKL